MTYRVVVWGTGNAGRPAIRAVAAHADLELAGVVVSNPAKVGRDAGELAYLAPLGVAATDDTSVALADDGQILIDKSRHFQYELGQWKDPESFLKA